MQGMFSLKQLSKSRSRRGRYKEPFQPYADGVDDKVRFLKQKLKRMKQGVPVAEVVREEMDEVCEKYPHMHGVYDGISRFEYAKMLRNRISALNSRVKKKSEERELQSLREIARRLFLFKKYDLLPARELELLKIENDDEFLAIVSYMTDVKKKTGSTGNNSDIKRQDIVRPLDHFLPESRKLNRL